MKAHKLLGHVSEGPLRVTLKRIGLSPTGTWRTCDGCARTKARQKRVNKITMVKATKPGERFFIDISGPFTKSIAGSVYWGKAVDD